VDTARQVIRWTIPGWLLIMFFAIFTMLKSIIIGTPLAEIINLVPVPAFSFAGLAIIGIPLGYVIYQIYYWGYWKVLPSRIVPDDRGQSILKDISGINSYFRDHLLKESGYKRELYRTDEATYEISSKFFSVLLCLLPSFRRIPRKMSKPERKELIEKYQDNWYLAEFAWYKSLSKFPHVANILQEEFKYLFDVFHSLGAVRVSVMGAIFFYIIYNFRVYWQFFFIMWQWEHWVALIINAFISVALFNILTAVRRNLLRQCTTLMRDLISYTYLKGWE